MPRPSTKTPDRIARMMALHRAGRSAREIGDELGLSHNAVGAWLKSAGLSPNGGCGARATRSRRLPDGTEQVIAAGEEALAELQSGPVPSDRQSAVAYLQTRLGQVSQLAQKFGALAGTGQTTITEFTNAVKLEQSLSAQIAEMSPREVHDPQSDPANVELATETRRKLERLIEHAERGTTCMHCGKNPFLIDIASGSSGSR